MAAPKDKRDLVSDGPFCYIDDQGCPHWYSLKIYLQIKYAPSIAFLFLGGLILFSEAQAQAHSMIERVGLALLALLVGWAFYKGADLLFPEYKGLGFNAQKWL